MHHSENEPSLLQTHGSLTSNKKRTSDASVSASYHPVTSPSFWAGLGQGLGSWGPHEPETQWLQATWAACYMCQGADSPTWFPLSHWQPSPPRGGQTSILILLDSLYSILCYWTYCFILDTEERWRSLEECVKIVWKLPGDSHPIRSDTKPHCNQGYSWRRVSWTSTRQKWLQVVVMQPQCSLLGLKASGWSTCTESWLGNCLILVGNGFASVTDTFTTSQLSYSNETYLGMKPTALWIFQLVPKSVLSLLINTSHWEDFKPVNSHLY